MYSVFFFPVLFSRSNSSGPAATSIITKNTRKNRKYARQFISCEKSYPSCFLGPPLMEGRDYAHVEIIVAFLVVNIFSFLIIASYGV